jgi:uncharacterized protein (DUF849 family)
MEALMSKGVIINCAITGSIHIPTMSPYLPITPQQIADEAVAAADAGAATVHLHARVPETGKPTPDPELFKVFCREIHQRSDVVICITTGGGLGMTPDQRLEAVKALKPELASLNMGSMNFGLFPLKDKIKDYKYEWEPAYLEMTRDFIFKNTFYDMERMLGTMKDNGTKPEMECYDVGHLYNAAYWADQGVIEPPFWFQFIFGIMGGIQPSVENLVHMRNTADKLFGRDYVWSVLAAGRHQFNLCTVGAVMGGSVRVGLEDNLYVAKGELAKSNADTVSKMCRILRELSLELATPDEARQILKLKGKDQTKFM